MFYSQESNQKVLSYYTHHSDSIRSFHLLNKGRWAIINASDLQKVLTPFHAQELLLNSSSWVDQVPNFRQEIRQSYYRNDPVKYDLSLIWSRIWECSKSQNRDFEVQNLKKFNKFRSRYLTTMSFKSIFKGDNVSFILYASIKSIWFLLFICLLPPSIDNEFICLIRLVMSGHWDKAQDPTGFYQI